jgi:hypothetical protein
MSWMRLRGKAHEVGCSCLMSYEGAEPLVFSAAQHQGLFLALLVTEYDAEDSWGASKSRVNRPLKHIMLTTSSSN